MGHCLESDLRKKKARVLCVYSVTSVEPIENDVTMFSVNSLLIMDSCISRKGIAVVKADSRKGNKACKTKQGRV